MGKKKGKPLSDEKETVHVAAEIPKDVNFEFYKIGLAEGIQKKDLLALAIKEYVKNHGDGNPNFLIDQWIEAPDMMAVPAMFRPTDDWKSYLNGVDEKQAQEIQRKAEVIAKYAEFKQKHGHTNVIVK